MTLRTKALVIILLTLLVLVGAFFLVSSNIFALIGVGVIFSIANLLLLERLVFSRLARLNAQVKSMEARGDPGLRVDMPGSDELGSLATSINAMLGALQKAEAELRQSHSELEVRVQERTKELEHVNIALKGEVTERKKAEEQVKKQLEKLSALRAIDQAITSSLDLRLTLNVLLGQITVELRIDAADILLLNPRTQILEYAGGRGFRTNALQYTRLRLGEGHAGRAALERQMVMIPDIAVADDGLRRSPLLPGEGFVAFYAAPLIAKGEVKGVLEIFHRSPLKADEEWLGFLEALSVQAAIAIDNAQLFDRLQRSNLELGLAYDTTLEGWSKALELREEGTAGHTQRVTDLTIRLAQELGIKEEDLVHVRRGGILHDIGKMAIPDRILLKRGRLTDEEWEVMKKHPVYAYEMLYPIVYLRPALDIPYAHHEKWDGSGYPRRLKGEAIPLAARVFAVADVWDALRSDRPYRAAWPREKAVRYIEERSGKDFDPLVVEVFVRTLAERVMQ